MIKNMNQTFLSCLLLLLLGVIWGTGYSIARYAMTHDVPPFGYSFWQAIGPAIIMTILSVILTKGTEAKKTTKGNHYKFYSICGLTGIVIPNTVMYFAAARLPASLLAMIVNIVPVICYPMALALKTEHFHWQRMVGVLFAFVGLMLIITPETSFPESNQTIPWVLMTLLAPLSFAFCAIYIAKFRPVNLNNIDTTAGMLIAASLLLLPFVVLTHSFYSLHYPLTLTDKIILLEIVLSSLGYLIFFQLIKIAGPVFYSLVDTIVVLTGVAWGHLLFGERLNGWTMSALFFILFGIILVTQLQSITRKEQANDKGL